MARRKRRVFTDEFKADTVRLCRAGDRSIAQISKDLDVGETALRKWMDLAKADVRVESGPKLALTARGARRAERAAQAREAARDGTRNPEKSHGLLCQGERMRFAFVLAEKAVWPVSVMCEVLRVSRSGYDAWRDRPASAHDQADAELMVDIKAAHEAGRGVYGSPRVHRWLRNNGTRVSRKRVSRLMKDGGIAGKRRKKFCKTTDSKHPDPIAPNTRVGAAFKSRAPPS